VTVKQITSASQTGRYVHTVHPNLRGVTGLQFVHPTRWSRPTALFGHAARPGAGTIERYAGWPGGSWTARPIFACATRRAYARWYGAEHPNPAWLDRFVYGLPERQRAALAGAHYASGVGCNATATILALAPLAMPAC